MTAAVAEIVRKSRHRSCTLCTCRAAVLGALRAKREPAAGVRRVVGMRRAARRHRGSQAIDLDRPARASARSHRVRARKLLSAGGNFCCARTPSTPLNVLARRARAVRGGRVLDIFWALWSRSWPLTLIFYLPFALPLELAFYFHSRRFVRKRSEELHTTFVGEPDAAEALRCWAHILSDRPPAELEELLRGWFLGEGEPRRGDYVRLVAFTVYNTTPEQLSTRQRDQVGGLVEAIEVGLRASSPPASATASARWRTRSTPSRRAPSHRVLPAAPVGPRRPRRRPPPLRLHSARDDHGPRPARPLLAPRAARRRVGRRAAVAAAARPPPRRRRLLPYALLLVQLRLLHSDGHIFVPVFPHCSLAALPALALTKRPPLPHELVHAIREMLSRHAPTAKGAAFLAHSLGTAALASIVKRAPELALATTFVDPICFELYSRHVLYNFLYARPRFSRRTAQHYAQRKLATEEPSVQDCFRRGFWWSQHWLAPTDLCCDTAVVLSGRTQVCPPATRRVRSRLASPNLPSLAVAHAPSVRGHCCAGRRGQEGDLARGRLPRDVVARLAADAPRRAAPHDPPASDDGRRRRRRTCRRRRRRHRPAALSYKLSLLSDLAASPLLRASSSTSRRRRGPCPPPRASRRRRPAPPRPPSRRRQQPPPPGCRRRRCRRSRARPRRSAEAPPPRSARHCGRCRRRRSSCRRACASSSNGEGPRRR